MKPTALHTARIMQTLNRLGFSIEESLELFKVERTLHRWHERECNGEINRDETTGKVYGIFECHRRGLTRTRLPIRDLKTAAVRKLSGIMASKPSLLSYVQPDPRGAALYICEKERMPNFKYSIESYYSCGLAVYNR